MTTTIQGDAVVFPDGSRQVTAAQNLPLMRTGQWGIGYKAIPGDITWASNQPPGNTSQAHGATPNVLWRSGTLDVGNRYTYPTNLIGSRAVDVTYTNNTNTPLYVVVTSRGSGDYAGITIFVSGVVASHRQGDMDNGWADISAWAVVPVGAQYSVASTTSYNGSGVSRWVEIGER